MRPILCLAMIFMLSACAGGEFMPDGIDASRLPVDKKGNLLFGRSYEW